MHTLLIPLVGFPLAIGFFSLYKDLRKVKNWNIERDRLAPTVTEQGLESIMYLDSSSPAGEKVEAVMVAVADGAGYAGVGLGILIERAEHFLPH
jgi:hypothetical protein